MKHVFALIGLVLLAPSVYYSTDFNPSWAYCLVVALASIAFFLPQQKRLRGQEKSRDRGAAQNRECDYVEFFRCAGRGDSIGHARR